MRRRHVAIFLTLCSPALCLSGRAADHPVSDTAALARALKSVRPGDTITMRDGGWRDAEIRLEANGTAELPITLRAQTPGEGAH